MFGRQIVRMVKHPATREITVTNDQGRSYRISEEQFNQFRTRQF